MRQNCELHHCYDHGGQCRTRHANDHDDTETTARQDLRARHAAGCHRGHTGHLYGSAMAARRPTPLSPREPPRSPAHAAGLPEHPTTRAAPNSCSTELPRQAEAKVWTPPSSGSGPTSGTRRRGDRMWRVCAAPNGAACAQFAFGADSGWPAHHWSAGTAARTSSIWAPQPDQVVLPQVVQGVGTHMSFSS